MSTNAKNLDLRGIRHQAWRAYMQDGLTELYAGLLLLSIAVFFLVDAFGGEETFLIYLIPVVVFPVLWQAARQRWTYPRLGKVNLVPNELLMLTAGLGAFLMVAVLVVIIASMNDPNPDYGVIGTFFDYFSLALGLGLGALCLLMAWRFGLNRFYGYALLSLLAGIITQYVDMAAFQVDVQPFRWGAYLGTMAVAFILTGLVMFLRFLRDYPPLDDDGAADDYHA